MAKYVPGPLISEFRGKLGGIVGTRNRYGAVIRVWVKPVVSTTEYATNAKARLGAATQAWQALTGAQKLAWTEFAASRPVIGALGEQQILTGHVAYVGVRTRMALAGVALLTDPPVGTPPLPLTSLTLTADIGAGDVEVAYTATPLAATEQLWIEACAVSSSGINYITNLLRWITTSPGAAASPYVFQAPLEARIGALQVGMTCHVMVSVFDNATGLLSAPLRDRVLVTTT